MNRTRVLAILFFVLYGFACYAPAIRNVGGPSGPQPPISGLGALVMGWFPPATIPWSANLMVAGGWTLFILKKYKTARVVGAVAFFTALMTWVPFRYQALMTGYYLWQASFLAFTACAHVAEQESARVERPSVVEDEPARVHEQGVT